MTQPEFVHEAASTSTIAPELRDFTMSPFSTSDSLLVMGEGEPCFIRGWSQVGFLSANVCLSG